MLGLLFTLLLASWAQASCPLADGDVVFIKSQTSQAELLKVSTGSDWSHVGMAFKRGTSWDVIEAVEPVRWTSLYTFLRRSRNLQFEIRRARFAFDAQKVQQYATAQLGKNYDLIFGWDDERWYCSELVWKAYQSASGVELGALEKIGDLKVNDPRVLAEARRRFSEYDIDFDEDDWKDYQVITPIQMMKSEHLELVLDQKEGQRLKDCLIK